MKSSEAIRKRIEILTQEIKALDKEIDKSPMSRVSSIEKRMEEKRGEIKILNWVLE